VAAAIAKLMPNQVLALVGDEFDYEPTCSD
jgi:hypothetical protein